MTGKSKWWREDRQVVTASHKHIFHFHHRSFNCDSRWVRLFSSILPSRCCVHAWTTTLCFHTSLLCISWSRYRWIFCEWCCDPYIRFNTICILVAAAAAVAVLFSSLFICRRFTTSSVTFLFFVLTARVSFALILSANATRLTRCWNEKEVLYVCWLSK